MISLSLSQQTSTFLVQELPQSHRPEQKEVPKETREKMARTIQQWWKRVSKRNLTKTLQNTISCKNSEKQSFTEICSQIRSSAVISSTQKLLSRIEWVTSRVLPSTNLFFPHVPKPVETFLSAFLFALYQDETVDIAKEKDKSLLESSVEMIRSYEKILDIFNTNKKQGLAEELKHFNECRKEYFHSFSERQKEHKMQMTSDMIDCYLRMEIRKNQISSTNPDYSQKQFYQALGKSQKHLLDKIHLFSGNEGIDLLFKKIETLSAQRAMETCNILCDESMKVDYEIALNSKFQFPFVPNSPTTQQVVKEVSETIGKPIVETAPQIAYHLLNLRKKIIQLVPNKITLVEELRTQLNADTLKVLVPQFSDPTVFLHSFLYLADIIHSLENPAHDLETNLWIDSIKERLKEGENPFTLLPELFRTFHNKIDQIAVEMKNAILKFNRPYWRREASKNVKENFESRLELYDLQLEKTERWVQSIIDTGNILNLTKEKICSKNASSHFLAAALIDFLRSSKKMSQTECPETLLIDRLSLNIIQDRLHKIKCNIVCLEIYRRLVTENGGIVTAENIKSLSDMLRLNVNNTSDLSHIVKKAIESSTTLPQEALDLIQGLITSSTSRDHRIYAIVNKWITQGFQYFLYKGVLPEYILKHPLYGLFPSLESIAEQINRIAVFNLSIHEHRYEAFIKEKQCGNLFKILAKPQIMEVEQCPVLLKDEFEELKTLHRNIVKLSLVATGLTVIRQHVWHTDESMSSTLNLTDQEIEEMIETNKIKELISSNNTTPEIIQDRIEEILDAVLHAKGIANSNIKKTKKILKNITAFKNLGYHAFHSEVVNIMKSYFKRRKIGTAASKTILRSFTNELEKLGTHLLQLVEKARNNSTDTSEELPFVLAAIPKHMHTGHENLSMIWKK